MFLRLLDWIIDSKCMYTSSASLHLELWIMDARFKIQKLLSQMMDAVSPILPQVKRKKGYQHGPHPKIEVPSGYNTTHGGVN